LITDNKSPSLIPSLDFFVGYIQGGFVLMCSFIILASKQLQMKLRLIFSIIYFCSLSVMGQNIVDDNGLKQGIWEKKYPWGATRYTGAFENDKEIGLFRFYDQNGKLISERNYPSPGAIADAIIYMPNGSVEAIGQFEGKEKTGEWKYFSRRGNLISTDVYIGGLKEGEERFFYNDSTLAEKVSWKANIKNGPWERYSSDASLELRAAYSNGELHGAYLSNHENGRKKLEGAYKKGLKHGKWFYYSKKGLQEKMEVYEYGDKIKTVIREGDELKTINHR